MGENLAIVEQDLIDTPAFPAGKLLRRDSDHPRRTRSADVLSSSAGKAVALLGSFSAESKEIGVTELARRSGLNKSTAFRLATVLVASRFLERRGSMYSVGPKVAELATLVSGSRRQALRDIALPYLQDLYESTHATVHLAVMEGPNAVYIEKLYGHNQVRMLSRVGATLNAGCCAVGKAMIAFGTDDEIRHALRHLRPLTPYTITTAGAWAAEIQTIRASGVAYDREESALGVTSVAAPVLDHERRPVCAVSVAGATGQFDPSTKANAARCAAAGIAAALDAKAVGANTH